MEMECRFSNTTLFKPCTTAFLCHERAAKTPGFEYQAIKSQPGYFKNWWLQYDLVCNEQSEIKKVVSYQFIGFFFGLPLMVVPDQLGRKKSMSLFLVVSIFAVYLCIYGSMATKKIGFFIQGAFHIRITVSFSHLIELVDNESKAMC